MTNISLRGAIVFPLLLALACGGCRQTWNGSYARYGNAPGSLNGTWTFGDMLHASGHRLKKTRLVTGRYDRVDTVVWFCESEAAAPSPEATVWFENWLREKPGRVLVVVPRTHEADYEYWTKTVPLAKSTDRMRAEAKRSEATLRRQRFLKASSATPSSPSDESKSDWFDLVNRDKPLTVDDLDGDCRWTERISATAGAFDVLVSMRPGKEGWTTLLSGNNVAAPNDVETLVATKRFGGSRLVVVQGGGFLLSGSLVNHERRKLAGRLIAELGPAPRKVVLLHMGAALDYRESEETALAGNSPINVLRMWPVAPLCWHLILLGIAYVFWRWPIFGCPRTVEETVVADFERHVDACADLLAATHDRTYAYEHIERYLRGEKGEGSGEREEGKQAGV